MSTKNIPQIMKTLSKIYYSSEETTLNRMRKKPNPYKVLISCLLSLRARDENTEVVSKRSGLRQNQPFVFLKVF